MIEIAIIQMEIRDGAKDHNLRKVLSILKELTFKDSPPDIICLPELFTTGYDLTSVNQLAEPLMGKTLTKIREIIIDNSCVIGTILEKNKDKFYNTAFILGKSGDILGLYRKVHLFSPMLEKEYLTAGTTITPFIIPELQNIKVGLAICYDLRFPELFRKLTLQGAEVIFVPSEFPTPKNDIWKTLLIARAIENQVFIIGTNRVGRGHSDSFFGHSMITDGDSHYILGNLPTVKTCILDFSNLEQIRKSLPLLKDRREELY
ncbi:MAG: putative Hydrolase MtnU [Promethearchaeota archaeon]|nr:MAG: putative Hydrolase MtnU [Candidatus Lokiarchaeota archaeon]